MNDDPRIETLLHNARQLRTGGLHAIAHEVEDAARAVAAELAEAKERVIFLETEIDYESAKYEKALAATREALELADELADRWEAIDGKADDFGRAWELVRYREARAALAGSVASSPAEEPRFSSRYADYVAWIEAGGGSMERR